MIRSKFQRSRGFSRLGSLWLGCWLSVACGLAAAGIFRQQTFIVQPKAADLIQPTALSSTPSTTVGIEKIRVGDRVMGQLSDAELAGETAIDESTWKKLRLYAEIAWDDGSVDDIHVETLQPPEWIEAVEAKVVGQVPLPLDLVEMGLPTSLTAKVVTIEECPQLESGPGRVVLTTVHHLHRSVYELTFESSAGKIETVKPTAFHKFYRADDGSWVSTNELQAGDTLLGIDGTLTVQQVTRVPGTHRVYNMTVEGEHVYRVAALGALVHNNCKKNLPDDELLGPPSKRGNAPIGNDGHPIELHHDGQLRNSPLIEMTRTDHRGAGNFAKNHHNTGQSASEIDRKVFANERRQHWREQWDNGRFDDLINEIGE